MPWLLLSTDCHTNTVITTCVLLLVHKSHLQNNQASLLKLYELTAIASAALGEPEPQLVELLAALAAEVAPGSSEHLFWAQQYRCASVYLGVWARVHVWSWCWVSCVFGKTVACTLRVSSECFSNSPLFELPLLCTLRYLCALPDCLPGCLFACPPTPILHTSRLL